MYAHTCRDLLFESEIERGREAMHAHTRRDRAKEGERERRSELERGRRERKTGGGEREILYMFL